MRNVLASCALWLLIMAVVLGLFLLGGVTTIDHLLASLRGILNGAPLDLGCGLRVCP